ncbi:hypothetical protein MICA_310 [Micavibrio aeruginosavorus ARL-13]|uniref:Uncharacterized protein n=1 Tax=Micavibrio aeruginosavorus (strain ARL-13) TaxID=856793 RepID=G2KR03_MICAA|nr:hypothetical protein MICA_310 [Micavibrio aeruginosavorus ARL-13]
MIKKFIPYLFQMVEMMKGGYYIEGRNDDHGVFLHAASP